MKIRDYLNETGGTVSLKPVTIKPDVKKKLNKAIYNMTSGKYLQSIPLDDIFKELESFGIVAVDEAGEPWSGFLTGRDGTAYIDLKKDGVPVKNAVLALQWHKMDTGKYELVCYVT